MVSAVFLATVALIAPAQGSSDYSTTYDEMRSIAPDPARTAVVSNLFIRRESSELLLTDGQITFLKPVGGRTVGVVFVGSGEFRLLPPLKVEQDQLARHFDAPSVREPIKSLVILFADSTEAELMRAVEFGPGTPDRDAEGVIEEAIDFLINKDTQYFTPSVFGPILNQAETGLYHLHMKPESGDPLYYRVDPLQFEEVRFGKKARGGGDNYQTITQFHRVDDYLTGRMLTEEPPRLVDLTAYEIDVSISGGDDFSARASVTVEPHSPPGSWVSFTLFRELEVDSLHWNGQPGTFFRGKDSGTFWVRLPMAAPDDEPLRMEMWYAGDLLRDADGWTALRSSTGWYPRHGRSLATFDLTFHSPDDYTLSSVGTLVSTETEDGVVTSRWATDQPAIHASFNLGDFEQHEIAEEDIPSITIQYSESAHRRLRRDLREQNLILEQEGEMGETVGFDVAKALRFFQESFGPLDTDHFIATEIPFMHGQAFPSMIHLSWFTFQTTGPGGYAEAFRAHEVAHQWWGLAVSPQSYHDTWLSEGLSEFSGLMYMQNVFMDPVMYRERLDEYRESIFKRRDDTGPIWLGDRAVGTDRRSGGDYQTVVYEKGAWIFHMLRNLMMDPEEQDDTLFREMMRTLYETHKGGHLTTEAFREAVEGYLGDMGWFFDQWVYGTGLPTYRFATKGETIAEGSYKMTVRVRQEGVADDFKMYIPLFLDFGDGGWARVRMLVEGPVTEVELPLLPREPDNVVFDDLRAVLAEIKNEDWN